MSATFEIWQFLAGLGIFIFGMYLLEDALKALSGKTFRRMIALYTRGRLRAIGSGVMVTTVLQSSTAVSLMVLAFVGAGIISMGNGIAMMMGANIGTTFTAWVVALLGFKLSIDSFAFPFIAIAGIGLVFSEVGAKLFNFSRFLIGFGFLFLGLNYMKMSVESLTQTFDLNQLHDYGLWLYLLVGIALTAITQSSSATIAIVLTAINSQLISFNMGVAMIIGANVGTTITVLLGSLGKGVRAKKIVGVSHLIFNLVTGLLAFASIDVSVKLIGNLVDINSNSVVGLAIFHTLFNVCGVIIFYPFIGLLTRTLLAIFPHRKKVLTMYLDRTPAEVTEAATAALTKEIHHLLTECQLYNLRVLSIKEKLVFKQNLPFEKNSGGKIGLVELYENIKLLHGEIFAYYARLQAQKLEESEVHNLERVIFASRNIMNSIKNFKGILTDLEEFDATENSYLNKQYKLFRQRLLALYQAMNPLADLESQEEQCQEILKGFLHIEEEDKSFIRETMKAVSDNQIQGMEISSLLLVNRLFTQGCRLQVFAIKDLLLSNKQISDFDRAMDMKELIEEEQAKELKNHPDKTPTTGQP